MMIGSSITHYRITGKLGAGGMGEVYRAVDTKLGRDVAIKVLPAAVANDPDRLARFEREAKVLAALNHPNIAQIYGIEACALVMELVEGGTIHGPLPPVTAIGYAKQIAEALEAAHEKGIVHRDLKPGNVMVTPAGLVKVLDFGLAVAQGAANVPDDGNSPTVAATQAGLIMGTAAYMSPEQASGKTVDRRTDIWAWGVVLSEMLTGKKPFQGETLSHTLAEVLTKDPDLSALPSQVRPVVEKCLRKDPRKRWHHIADARLALEESASLPAIASPERKSSKLPWLLASAAAILAAILATPALIHVREKAPPPAQPVRFEVAAPAPWDRASHLLFSPDGSRLLYSAPNSPGGEQLWVRDMNATEARILPGAEGSGSPSLNPFWSADGRQIAFSVDGKLKRISVTGGPVETICDLPDGDTGGGAWNAEGVILMGSQNHGLFQVPAAGGVPTPVTTRDETRHETFHRRPVFLPDGRHFLYVRGGGTAGGIFVGTLDAPPAAQSTKPLMAGRTGVAFAARPEPGKGYVLFLREQILMAQPFDTRRLELTGEPSVVADSVGSNPGTIGYFSAPTTGRLAYRSSTALSASITWFDRKGKVLGMVGSPGIYTGMALSPDSGRVAVARLDRGNEDIWLLDVARNTGTRFTFGGATAPLWSPDGRSIVFVSRSPGAPTLYRKSSDGGGREELVLKSDGFNSPQSWSRDGRIFLYSTQEGGANSFAVHSLLAGYPEPILPTEPFARQGPQLSPDGRYLAYLSVESGTMELYVRPWPDTSQGKWMVSNGGAQQARWRGDGRELFYLADGRIMSVQVEAPSTASPFRVSQPAVLFSLSSVLPPVPNSFSWDVTPDGLRFLILVPERATDSTPIAVVLNWASALGKPR